MKNIFVYNLLFILLFCSACVSSPPSETITPTVIVPSETPTSVPTNTPTPSLGKEYISAYGLSFRYPEGWSVFEQENIITIVSNQNVQLAQEEYATGDILMEIQVAPLEYQNDGTELNILGSYLIFLGIDPPDKEQAHIIELNGKKFAIGTYSETYRQSSSHGNRAPLFIALHFTEVNTLLIDMYASPNDEVELRKVFEAFITSIEPVTASDNSESIEGFSVNRLITETEINSISSDIGVIQWELVDVLDGENALRHTFRGTSWSANPNEALNSIIKISPASTFEDIISSMLDSGLLFPDAFEVDSSLTFEEEFVVYASTAPNGHSVYDLLVSKDGLLYWASVSLGTSVGANPESTYNDNQDVIDSFLNNMIMINFER